MTLSRAQGKGGAMQEIVDQLIEERAPWMRRDEPQARFARVVLNRVLQYHRSVRIAETLKPMPPREILGSLGEMIARHVEVTGIENVPRSGACIVVSNHPTGIADGIVLYKALAQARPDLFIFANADALRVLPQLSELIAPVEWRPEKRTHKQNRETLAYAQTAFEEGRMAVIFPSGRLAKRRWLSLHERPWMASAAMLARKYNLPVTPLHITARNSALFYLFDRIHPTLRDITLFHEVLNKRHQPYRITIGAPIDPATLPSGSTEATEVLRSRTLELGGERPQTVLTAPRYSRPNRRLLPARTPV